MQVSGYRIVAIRASTNFVQETTVFRNASRHGHPPQETALQSTAKFDHSNYRFCGAGEEPCRFGRVSGA